jgi:hypothetical protein
MTAAMINYIHATQLDSSDEEPGHAERARRSFNDSLVSNLCLRATETKSDDAHRRSAVLHGDRRLVAAV